MITIACTNCKTQLTMDEAFAGGVCRCQHCGTIQTVPSHLKQGSTAGASTGQAVGTSKSLYQQQSRASTDAASGLEALGDVVTSSGLGSRRLQSPAKVTSPGSASIDRAAGQAARPGKNPLLVPLLIAVAVVVVLVIGLVVFLATRSNTPAETPAGSDNSHTGGTSEVILAPVAGPSFLGTAIKGSSVVYIIDHGNATSDYFDSLKAALIKSLHSLGSDRTFQVMLWDNKSGDQLVFPQTGVVDATDNNIQTVQNDIRDIDAGNASSMSAQLAKAVALKPRPDAIVIATGKPESELSDSDVAALKRAAKAGVPLYLFAIGETNPSTVMSSAANASHGAYRPISKSQLDQLSQ